MLFRKSQFLVVYRDCKQHRTTIGFEYEVEDKTTDPFFPLIEDCFLGGVWSKSSQWDVGPATGERARSRFLQQHSLLSDNKTAWL